MDHFFIAAYSMASINFMEITCRLLFYGVHDNLRLDRGQRKQTTKPPKSQMFNCTQCSFSSRIPSKTEHILAGQLVLSQKIYHVVFPNRLDFSQFYNVQNSCKMKVDSTHKVSKFLVSQFPPVLYTKTTEVMTFPLNVMKTHCSVRFCYITFNSSFYRSQKIIRNQNQP